MVCLGSSVGRARDFLLKRKRLDMEKEDKQLLLKDLSARLRYGVKILYEGWDSDRGCDYELVEDFVGIDDSFIYTTWRGERKKHSINHMESIRLFLRPMSSMTEEEETLFRCELPAIAKTDAQLVAMRMELFLKGHLDFNHLIEKGLALEAPEGMYKTE